MTVEWGNEINVSTVEVYDAMGRRIAAHKINTEGNQIRFSSNNWDAGIYFIRLVASEKVITRSVIKS